MKNKKLFFAKYVAIFTILALLLTACGPKQPDPTNPIGSAPAPSVIESCNAALNEYLLENADADGSIVYSAGSYFAVIGGQLYSAENIQPYDFSGAGASILPAVADFRGVPYITDGQTAKACNYSLDVNADGKKNLADVTHLARYTAGWAGITLH